MTVERPLPNQGCDLAARGKVCCRVDPGKSWQRDTKVGRKGGGMTDDDKVVLGAGMRHPRGRCRSHGAWRANSIGMKRGIQESDAYWRP